MDQSYTPPKFTFHGSGATFFGIWIVNTLLTLVTFGIYYPWARAKVLRYSHAKTELDGSAFSFSGTGNELFKGFIIAMAMIGVWYSLLIASYYGILKGELVFCIPLIALVLAAFAAVPYFTHGAMKYRTSRTTWRQIRFGYDGNRREYIGKYFVWGLLTVVTLGFYSIVIPAKQMQYIYKHIRVGTGRLNFNGTTGDYLMLSIFGSIVSVVTFGIYFFWYFRDTLRYTFNNISLEIDGQQHSLKTDITTGQVFLMLISWILLPLTLGLAYPWLAMYNERVITNSISFTTTPDFAKLGQINTENANATGMDGLDLLDVDSGMILGM
jgi:uncharacterized membrane protein YjgN (DUF898 family)